MESYNKFEKARILSARALQLSMDAPILIKRPKDMFDVISIAKKEMEEGVLPITIKRD
ncbi:DNA-directed RNA polymerase subunit K [Candidatus Tiddalikarchaeum anstoanum]|nr:DNA-directed RNA polymerase subunit K [Candidatus Tiddalikarchaeum anstoanum]